MAGNVRFFNSDRGQGLCRYNDILTTGTTKRYSVTKAEGG
jgi:hypothetical protein